MRKQFSELKRKLPMALMGVRKVLARPRYATLGLILALLFAVLIYFFINIGFYGPLMTSRLSLGDKAGLVVKMTGEMLNSFVTTPSGALLAVVALLQGAAFAVMTYTMRRNKQFDSKVAGRGGLAMFAAAVGLGCVPCGTSLIVPLITLFFSSSALAAASVASVIVLALAFVLSLYSLYSLGNAAYAHVMIENESEVEDGDKKD